MDREAWLAEVELLETERGVVEDLGGLLDAIAAPIGRVEREIRARAKPGLRVEARQTCPVSG